MGLIIFPLGLREHMPKTPAWEANAIQVAKFRRITV